MPGITEPLVLDPTSESEWDQARQRYFSASHMQIAFDYRNICAILEP